MFRLTRITAQKTGKFKSHKMPHSQRFFLFKTHPTAAELRKENDCSTVTLDKLFHLIRNKEIEKLKDKPELQFLNSHQQYFSSDLNREIFFSIIKRMIGSGENSEVEDLLRVIYRSKDCVNNKDDITEGTALQEAVINDQLFTSKILLLVGADPFITGRFGQSAYDKAEYGKKTEFTLLFRDYMRLYGKTELESFDETPSSKCEK